MDLWPVRLNGQPNLRSVRHFFLRGPAVRGRLSPSKDVTQRRHMKVQAWVMRAESSVLHVLEAVADSNMTSHIPVNPAVRSKLKQRPDISIAELVSRDDGGQASALEEHGPTAVPRHEHQPGRRDEGVMSLASEPSSRTFSLDAKAIFAIVKEALEPEFPR